MGKSVVLLGAGASVEAGLPTAVVLPDKLLAFALAQGKQTYARAIKYTLHRLAAHHAISKGAVGSQLVDIEELGDALEQIANRKNSVLSPFVNTWDSGLDALELKAIMDCAPMVGRVFPDAVATEEMHVDLRSVPILRALYDNSDLFGNFFRNVFFWTSGSLRKLLAIPESAELSYLQLLTSWAYNRGAPIVNLNYDRAIEIACGKAGISVDTGMTAWNQARRVTFSPSKLPLLKLHGSLDWQLIYSEVKSAHVTIETLGDYNEQYDNPESPFPFSPAIIFGRQGKLNETGPFLVLYSKFRDLLEDAEELIVVGYSFRDPHINRLIADWIGREKNGKVTIIDPSDPTDQIREPGGNHDIYSIRSRRTLLQRGAAEGIREFINTAS